MTEPAWFPILCGRCHGTGNLQWEVIGQSGDVESRGMDCCYCEGTGRPEWLLSPAARLRSAASSTEVAGLARLAAILNDIADQMEAR